MENIKEYTGSALLEEKKNKKEEQKSAENMNRTHFSSELDLLETAYKSERKRRRGVMSRHHKH